MTTILKHIRGKGTENSGEAKKARKRVETLSGITKSLETSVLPNVGVNNSLLVIVTYPLCLGELCPLNAKNKLLPAFALCTFSIHFQKKLRSFLGGQIMIPVDKNKKE